MPPSNYYRSRRPGLSPEVATPLAQAYNQEAQAAQQVDQAAKEQDTVRQIEDDLRQRKATEEKFNLGAAKRQGALTQADPATGKEVVQRDQTGNPVYEAGFLGGPKVANDGKPVVEYRDPRGQVKPVPLDGIQRTEDPTGETFYEFDLDGQKVRRPEEKANPLFKIDPATGRRFTETQDPTTGAIVPQPLGIDPKAANQAAINRRKAEYAKQTEARKFQADELRLQQQVFENEYKPIKEQLTEAEKAAKDYADPEAETERYEQRQDGLYRIEKAGRSTSLPIKLDPSDPASIASGQNWLRNKKQAEERVAQLKAEHDPRAAQLAEMQAKRDRLALEALRESNRVQTELSDMEEADKAGLPLYKPEWRKKLDVARKDPRYQQIVAAGDYADSGSDLADDVARVDMPSPDGKPAPLSIAQRIFKDLADVPRTNYVQTDAPVDLAKVADRTNERSVLDVLTSGLTAGRDGAPEPKDIAQARELAAKSLGVTDPEAYSVTRAENGGFNLFRAGSDTPIGRLDPNAKQILVFPSEAVTEAGQELLTKASKDGFPVYRMGGGTPMTAQELRDYVAKGVSIARSSQTPDQKDAALAQEGITPADVRERVFSGRMSVQDGKWLQEKLFETQEVDNTPDGVKRGLTEYLAQNPTQAALMAKGKPEDKAEVINRFMDQRAAQSNDNLFLDRSEIAARRQELTAQLAGKGSLDKAGSFIKQTLAPMVGIAGQAAAIIPQFIAKGLGKEFESGRLADQQFADWTKRTSGYLTRIREREGINFAVDEFRSWASRARPGEKPPEELAARIAKEVYDGYHELTPDAAKSLETSLDTFNVNKDPMLGGLLQRYLTTANPSAFSELASMLAMDARDRKTQAEVMKYVEAPRAASPADVLDRTGALGIQLDERRAADLLDLAKSQDAAKTPEARAAITAKAQKLLGTTSTEDTELVFDALTKQATDDPDSWWGLTKGGFVAGRQELATELVTTAAEAGVAFATGGGATPAILAERAASTAAKGGIRAAFRRMAAASLDAASEYSTTFAKTRSALSRGRARLGAEIAKEGDKFAKAGMLTEKFGQPLAAAQKARNLGVATLKTAAAGAPMEAVEEGIASVGEADATLGGTLESMAMGAAGAGLITPIFSGMAAVSDVFQARRAGRTYEQQKVKFVEQFNERMSKTPGFKAITPADFDTWQAIQSNPSHQAAVSEYMAAVAERDALTEQVDTPENGMVSDATAKPAALIAAEAKVEAASQNLAALSEVAFGVADELRAIPEAERPLYTGAAKAAAGATDFTADEAKALIKQSGANAVAFQQAETLPAGVQGPQQLKTLADLPEVSTVAPSVYRLPAGVSINLPPALLDTLRQAAPSMVDLLAVNQQYDTTTAPPETNTKSQAPAAQSGEAPKGTAAGIPEANVPESLSPDGQPPVSDSPKPVAKPKKAKRLPKDLAGAKPRYSYGSKGFELAFDSDVDLAAYIAAQKTPSKRDADYVKFAAEAMGVDEATVRAHGAKVREAIKAQAKDATPGRLVIPDQFTPAPAPQAQQPAPVASAKGLEQLARRVIGEVIAKSPKIKELVKEAKKDLGYPNGGMWMNANGTISFYMPTLLPQLDGLDETTAAKRVAALLDEEIRHSANITASKRLFAAEKNAPGNLQGVNYETWRDAWYGDIWDNHFTEEMREKVREAYGDTLPPDKWMQAMEGLRMLDQLRATGSITEAVLRHLEAVIEALREFLTNATPTVKREIANIQAVLQEYGYEAGAVRQPKAKSKPAKPRAKKEAATDKESLTVEPKDREEEIPDPPHIWKGTRNGQPAFILYRTPAGEYTVQLGKDQTIMPEAAAARMSGLKKAEIQALPDFPEKPKARTRTDLDNPEVQIGDVIMDSRGSMGPVIAIKDGVPVMGMEGENEGDIDPEKAVGGWKLEEKAPANTSIVPALALPDPTLADQRNRWKFPGRNYAAPPNSVVMQVRGLDTEPKNMDMLAVVVNGDKTKAANVVKNQFVPLLREVDGSMRESPIAMIGPDGAVIFHGEIDIEGNVEWSAPSRRKPTTPTQDAPDKQVEAKNGKEKAQKEPIKGEVGGMYGSGDILITSSGRTTTPFPDIKADTNRKLTATTKRVDAWLRENAIAEAESRGDEFNARPFRAENPAKMPPATKDSMEEYLFGQQPKVIPSILKPMVAPKPAPTPEELAAEAMRENLKGLFSAPAQAKDAEYLAAVEAGDMDAAQTMVDAEIAKLIESLPRSNNEERVPNSGSVASSLGNHRKMGVRDVPISYLLDTANTSYPSYMVGGQKRTLELADSIEENGIESPMILVWENDQFPYVLEGSTRYDALRVLAATGRQLPETVPALVVIDDDADPVAKDESGRIIPLSERFNIPSDSILFSAPAGQWQEADIPEDRIPGIMQTTKLVFDAGIRTPEDFAAFMERTFPGGASRPYVAGIWQIMGGMKREMRTATVPDWQGIYAGIDKPLPEIEEPAEESGRTLVLSDAQEAVSNRVKLGLSGPIGFEIKELREMASNLTDKQFDEAVELGITMAAHELVKRGGAPAEIYSRLVTLYERQPKLAAKTSTSKINQAYSTPAPMAYVASRLADVRGGKIVEERSVGNGMLLLERTPEQTILANELDPARRERLAMQGIEATGEDATTWTPPQRPTRVIGNPPFGQVMLESGDNRIFTTSAGDTTSIDHAILLKSLETMTDDGRAAFIIGGPPPTVRTPEARAAYYRGTKQGKFFGYLHENYNVIDHFTVSGDLYEKQGAGWPLDIIVVRGKGRSANTLPGLKSPRIINTWEELANELTRTDAERIQLNQLTADEMRDRVDSMAGKLEGLSGGLPGTTGGVRPSRAGRPKAESRTPEANRNDVSGNAGTSADATPAGNIRDGSPELASGDVRGVTEGTPAPDQSGGGSLRTGDVTEFQAPFPASSGVNPAGLLAPVNLIGPMSEAMAKLKEAVGGDLVAYARDKMGYPKGTDISKFFFGDQIDAIAQAIHTSENGGSLVIGDQTGTGKGRIAAGLMKYAVKQGMIPVFVTKNQDLFDAMLDDLRDIDALEIVPVLSNTDIKEKSLKEKLKGLSADSGKEAFQEISQTGNLPGSANVVFTTYDQIKSDDAPGVTPRDRARHKRDMEAPPGGWRMEALRRIAPNAMFILDESHLAGGQSTTGWRFGELLTGAKSVYYSSATFAKRPDNMGIYFRTNLGRVGGNINGLIGLMQAGGVPAMQIGSSMLAQDGQYMRRERSFDGVTFQTQVNQATYERDKDLADNYTEGLRAIISVQERMAQAAEIVNTILNAFGKSANIPMGNRARLESSNFSAKLHNLVRQYLLAIKANSAAQLAIKAIKEGSLASDGTIKRHKVIVAVENTMESVINNLQAANLPLNFNGVLQMYLEQMRSIKVSGGAYGREAQYFVLNDEAPPEFATTTDVQLRNMLVVSTVNPETGEPAFTVNQDAANEMIRRAMVGVMREAKEVIEEINLADMPLSPIDAMRQAVEREGIRTGEMTGRTTGIDKNGQPYQRSASEVKGKLQAKDDFNNADLDFLVINKTGSTGVSMHASEKFKDRRPRMMMIVQANLDINEFMQTIGRIHRAGQVELPSYLSVQTALPAENRPAAILGRKMAMLNANTTSNADSELSQAEVADIFNQYGDEVVHGYLVRNPGLVRLISQSWANLTDGGSLKPLSDFQDEESGGHGYLARSVTGHLAILPVDEQEAFWETVTADYRGLIEYLDQIGKNELRASALDMKAETVSSDVFTQGTDDGSVFGRPSFIETVNARLGKKPLEVDEAIQAANTARTANTERQDTFLKAANAFIDSEDARKAIVSKNWDERRQDWINGQQEQRDTISNAVGQIGMFGTYERDDGSSGFAFVEDVQLNQEKPNTPSAQFAIVRVNDSQDRLKLPVSQVAQFFKPVMVSEYNRERTAREGWKRSWTFGTQQAIVTGNLLTALQELSARNIKPRVVSYTKIDGSQQMGILLGQTAAAQVAQSGQQTLPVSDSDMMLEMVRAGYTVKNTAGNVRMVHGDGPYYLYVPSARSTGGKYWRDPGLLRITGEFEGSGSDTFVATMDAGQLKATFDYLARTQSERFVRPVASGEKGGNKPISSAPAPSMPQARAEAIVRNLTPKNNAGKLNPVEARDFAAARAALASSPAPKPDQSALKDALAQMQPIARRALELAWSGKSVEEIAKEINLSVTAVGNLLRVSNGRLRFLLERNGAIKPNVRIEDGKVKATSGRPDLAGSGNAAFAAVDQRRMSPEEVTHAEMNELAADMFAADPVAAEKLVVRWMDSGTTVLSTDGMPEAIQRIVNDAQARTAAEMLMTAAAKLLVTEKALSGGDSLQTARLIDLYRTTGTEQARALGMRQDPHATPEERAAMYLSESLLTPPESLRNEIRRNPANKERILAEWARQADAIKADLKAEGYDIDATFAEFRKEQKMAEAAIPAEVKIPLGRATGRVRKLVRAVLEGLTPREAAARAGMTLEAAREAYNKFRGVVNDAGAQAAQQARDALLRSAPAADFAANIGLPEWLEDAVIDTPLIKTAKTEELKKQRTKKKAPGELDLKNPVAVVRAKRSIEQRKSGTFDMISEYWRASILSGPQTHVVNVVSGLAYGTYEATFKKLAAGAQGDVARMFGMNPDAASLADMPAMIAGVLPAIKQAFTDSIRSWKSEQRLFDSYTRGQLDNLDAEGLFKEQFQPAMKGKFGTFMRSISFRAMGAADEFVKSFFTRIEVAAQAHQIARTKNLKGQELANEIAYQMTPGSEAWVRALDQAKKITFQTEIGSQSGSIDKIDEVAKLISETKKGRYGTILKGMSHFVFPFVDTPTNIFKAGITMSPVGGVLALIDGARSLNQRRKGNKEDAAKLYNAARLFDDMTNQIVAWGVILAISELVKPGEDEDETPYITGTMAWRTTAPGEREIAYRTAPPQSIRIGDKWYSYKRLDPFASALAFTVDAIKQMQSGKPLDEAWGQIGLGMVRNMQDKTFLQGVSDLMNAINDPERFGTKWAVNIATGFVPNLIRQPIRTADPTFRDSDLPNDMPFWQNLGTRVGYGVVSQSAPPAFDVWGREADKNTGTGGPLTDFALRLFSPVDTKDAGNADPLDVALLRYNMTAEEPFGITAPSREIRRKVNGEEVNVSLTDAQREEMARKAGQAARLAIGSRFNGRDLTDDDAETIKATVLQAQRLYREIAFRQAMAEKK